MKKIILTSTAMLFVCAGLSTAQVVRLPLPGGVTKLAEQGVRGLAAGNTSVVLSTFSGAALRRAAVQAVLPNPVTYSTLLESSTFHYYDATKDRWILRQPHGDEVLPYKPVRAILTTPEDVILRHMRLYGENSVIPDPVSPAEKAQKALRPAVVQVPNPRGGFYVYQLDEEGAYRLQPEVLSK